MLPGSMSESSRRVDPLSFPILGLIGAFACGPSTPQDPDSGTGDATTDATTDHGPDPRMPDRRRLRVLRSPLF